MQLFEEAGRLVVPVFTMFVPEHRGISTLQNSRPPRDRSTISHRAHSRNRRLYHFVFLRPRKRAARKESTYDPLQNVAHVR